MTKNIIELSDIYKNGDHKSRMFQSLEEEEKMTQDQLAVKNVGKQVSLSFLSTCIVDNVKFVVVVVNRFHSIIVFAFAQASSVILAISMV